MQKMRVGIIGLGFVGSAVRYGFTRLGHEVAEYDIKDKTTSLDDVLKTGVTFICVPTPQARDGSCDTSIVEEVVKKLAKASYSGLVCIKSSIEPGTTDRLSARYPKLRIAHSPEFLRERSSYADFTERNDICVIGTYTDADAKVLLKTYGSLPKEFAIVKPIEAELAKYFMNVFNALRIVFANQFYDVCKASGADYQKIKSAMIKHRTIPDIYIDCNENLRGFGGACLPKDTSAFARYAKKLLGKKQKWLLFDKIVEINRRYKITTF